MEPEEFERLYPSFNTFLNQLFDVGNYNEDLSEILFEEAMQNVDFATGSEFIVSLQGQFGMTFWRIIDFLHELISKGDVYYIGHTAHDFILNNIACFNNF